MIDKELLAEKVLLKLNENGFKAYFVGGCVRDKLLLRHINDWDITTNALPNQIKDVFTGFEIIEAGIKHGTVGVVIEGIVFEITTFRADGEYKDCRHPKNVDFVNDIYEDLSRRDFTMNAIAYNKIDGFIDYYGGKEDITNRLIRAVGDAEKRFNEDALRILRAVRFAATLGFEVEKNTYKAMLVCKRNLKFIAKERLYEEMNKALLGDYAHIAFRKYKEIIFEIIPELIPCDGFDQKSLSHAFDVYEHTLVAMSLAKVRTPTIMWAVLLHDIAKPQCFTIDKKGYGHTNGHMEKSAEISKTILTRLKAPKKLVHDVYILVYNHDREIGDNKYSLKCFLHSFGLSLAKDLLTVKKADMYAHSQHGIDKYNKFVILYENFLNEIITKSECYSFDSLNIDGNDLLSLGFVGERVGEVKENLLHAVMSDKVKNERNLLIDFAKNLKK